MNPNETQNGISILIPVYNEADSVLSVLKEINKVMPDIGVPYEIIAINDGSSDGSKNIFDSLNGIKVHHHPYNKGYGASIKSGAELAKYDWLLMIDGDGQHRAEYIINLWENATDFDMIVGSRTGYLGPWIRQPGKYILKKIASYLIDQNIPDLNSGMRLVKKNLFFRFINLYPNNFSLTTTITMAFFKDGLNVKYVPIQVNKRMGKSTVSPRHALQTFILITRIITLFSPMRFFFPISLIFVLIFFISLGYDIFTKNVSDTTILTFMASVMIFFFGIVLDQIAFIRRELNKNN